MSEILIIAGFTVVLSAIFVGIGLKLIIQKKKGIEVNFKKKIPVLILLFVLIIASSVYNIVLAVTLINENKSKIAEVTSEAFSDAVGFGSTILFEGLGKSFDHFEEKWDKELIDNLNNIQLTVIGIDTLNENTLDETLILENNAADSSIDSSEYNKIVFEISLLNKNTKKEDIYFSTLIYENYILLQDSDDVCYQFNSEENLSRKIIVGKSSLKLYSVVPKDVELTKILFGNQEIEL